MAYTEKFETGKKERPALPISITRIGPGFDDALVNDTLAVTAQNYNKGRKPADFHSSVVRAGRNLDVAGNVGLVSRHYGDQITTAPNEDHVIASIVANFVEAISNIVPGDKKLKSVPRVTRS